MTPFKSMLMIPSSDDEEERKPISNIRLFDGGRTARTLDPLIKSHLPDE
jgi:hypothetical protein